MNGKMTILLGIAVVAIVVTAGVLIVNNNDKDSANYEDGASRLQIRGNVNDDMTIDSKDMEILEKVISEEYKLEDYPLADVNGDGKADDTDKQLLQDLIDRKSGTDVYVICLDRSGNTTAQKVTYPLRNVVTYATNAQMPTLFANGGQYIAGYFSSSYANAEASISDSARDLKGSARQITDSAWANFTKLDADLETGVGAIIADYSGIAQFTDARAADLEEGNIPLLVFSSADTTSEITTVLTLGFLFGGDCETMGVNYATESWKVINEIGEKQAGLSDDDKVTYIGCTMYIYICQNDSTFASSGILAGGMPYYKTNSAFAEAYAGTGSVQMAGVEALSNYQDIGAILNNRSIDWGLDPSEVKGEIIDAWDHDNAGISSTQYFKGFDEELAYIDNLLPGAVKVAYMAHAMYGDDFSIDYANNVLLKFIGLGTEPLKGQTLDTIVPYIDKGIYDAAVNKQAPAVGDNALNIANSLYKNYTGKYKTGAADATYAFAAGSGENSATLTVANGNTDPELDDNTIKFTVANDAKTAYTAKYAEYSALTSGENAYTAATLTGDFYGAYACYRNDGGVGIAHLTAYVETVVVDCYLYESYEITNDDLQALVTAMYAAATNPVEYDGDPIPSGAPTGAKLAAETVAANENWDVASTPEATSAAADLLFSSRSAMNKPAQYTIKVVSAYPSASLYSEKCTAVDGHMSETVSTTAGTYVAYATAIDGADLHAIYGHIDTKPYSYVYFVLRVGDIVIYNDAKTCLYNTTEGELSADTLAFFTLLANGAKAAATTGAAYTVNALAGTDSDAYSVKEDPAPTAASAVAIFHSKNGKGNAADFNLAVTAGDSVVSDYTAKSAIVDGHSSEQVSNAGGSYVSYSQVIDGLELHALYGHIVGKQYSYVFFVAACNGKLIDCSDSKVCIFNSTEADLEADTLAFFTQLRNAML